MTAEPADGTWPAVTAQPPRSQPPPEAEAPEAEAPEAEAPEAAPPEGVALDAAAPDLAGAARLAANRVVAELVTRARNGDEQAWGALVERYAPLIWSICRKHRLTEADAEDVAQSIWLRLVDQLDRVRDPAALPGWLATTTRRECARVVRAAQGPLAAGYVLDAEILPDEHGETAEEELLVAERHAALRAAFADLPLLHQRLITMITADPPVPYAEISARLGIAVGGIGPTRARCLDRLRRHPAIASLLADDEPGEG